MDIRHLRYFIAVAEERHFTRAADRLGLKQPPLSHQIQQLEAELNTRLFRRLTRGVELTDTGTFLLGRARQLVADFDQVKADLRSRALGRTGSVKLGFASATYALPLVTRIIRTYRDAAPDVELSLCLSNTTDLLDQLRAKTMEVAFVRSPRQEYEDLSLVPIVNEDMIVAVPTNTPLARRRSISARSLVQEPLVLFPRVLAPGLYDRVLHIFHSVELAPRLGQEAPDIPSMPHLVAAGFGVAILPATMQHLQPPGVVYRPFDDVTPAATITLAYRRDGSSRAVVNLVDTARRLSTAEGCGEAGLRRICEEDPSSDL